MDTTTDTTTDAAATPTSADDQPLLVDVPAELEPERPPLVGADGRVRLSFSRVDTYENCPRKFRYRYVDRLPSRPAPALSFGTSVHGALERFYDRKLPEEPSEDELLGFLYEEWEQVGFAELDRAEQLAYYRQAQDVLRRYHRRVTGRSRLPVATEAWFELPIGERATVVGAKHREVCWVFDPSQNFNDDDVVGKAWDGALRLGLDRDGRRLFALLSVCAHFGTRRRVGRHRGGCHAARASRCGEFFLGATKHVSAFPSKTPLGSLDKQRRVQRRAHNTHTNPSSLPTQ